jgi:hypothetical protein
MSEKFEVSDHARGCPKMGSGIVFLYCMASELHDATQKGKHFQSHISRRLLSCARVAVEGTGDRNSSRHF